MIFEREIFLDVIIIKFILEIQNSNEKEFFEVKGNFLIGEIF